ncbi:MAG: 4,5-DOPA dioxygenase extradiol [Candidatus Baltobacteraceae bacterium]
MPAVFIGHGSPMNAITDTPFSRVWRTLGKQLARPSAILAISAHWYIDRTAVTAHPHPPTIHDFYGFPKALHDVRYPAPGDPALADDVINLLKPLAVEADLSWGLDHGTWSVLLHMYPEADIPVVQIAIDASKPPAFHFELGQRLAALRERNVLLLGSGNVVHNLRMLGDIHAQYPWADRFDAYVRDALVSRDRDSLTNYRQHPDAATAAPDPDHYFPLLYIAGARSVADELRFLIDGKDLASISMTAFSVG